MKNFIKNHKILSSLIVLLLLLVSFLGYIVYDIGRVLDPQVYYNEDARKKINSFFGYTIPDSTKDHFYFYQAFQDSSCWISFTVSEKDAWKIIKKFIKKDKRDFEPLTMPHTSKEYPQMDTSKLKNPLVYQIQKPGITKTIIYDNVTQRLLIWTLTM